MSNFSANPQPHFSKERIAAKEAKKNLVGTVSEIVEIIRENKKIIDELAPKGNENLHK